MPTVGGKFLRAILCLAVAAFLYQTGQHVATVTVTVLADGQVETVAVDDDDPRYKKELRRANRKAMALYVGAGLMTLICFGYLRGAARIHRGSKQRVH